jgi:hypothetical protein
MNLKSALIAVTVVTLAAVTSTTSRAALVTETIDFSFSNFSVGSPIDPWAGSFTLTYDPSLEGTSGPLTAFSSNLPGGYGAFSWNVGASGQLVIGDSCSFGSCNVTTGFNQAAINITFAEAFITTTTNPQEFFGSSTSTIVTQVASVPEPSTWAMLLFGFAGIGFATYRRKTRQVHCLATK